MILVDTTVLVYAVGSEHPLREPARAVIAAVGSGALDATTTPQVIQEFAHVRGRRRGRQDAAHVAARYAQLLGPLASTPTRALSLGLRLWESHEALGAFDAVLAAVALELDVELLSADRGFAAIPGLRWRDLSGWLPA